MEKYTEMIDKLENEELESEVLQTEMYIKLLAAYLYTNQLIEAKHLCRRLPLNIKVENKEIQKLHQLTLALISNSYAEFFENINFAWSESIKQCMEDVACKIREDVLNLVGNAYESINETNLMKLTYLNHEQLKEACESLSWQYEDNNSEVIVKPKKPAVKQRTCATSEDQLYKLTEFVSFLEN